jgi:hypothetical protein
VRAIRPIIRIALTRRFGEASRDTQNEDSGCSRGLSIEQRLTLLKYAICSFLFTEGESFATIERKAKSSGAATSLSLGLYCG